MTVGPLTIDTARRLVFAGGGMQAPTKDVSVDVDLPEAPAAPST